MTAADLSVSWPGGRPRNASQFGTSQYGTSEPGAPACDLAVIGCGDPSRGDDGVGPALVRQLRGDGVPPRVRLVDGGAAGTDIAAALRGAKRVIVVDASHTGAAPGTVCRVPGLEVQDMPPLSGLHTGSFGWDHALAFARWLLGAHYPSDVTVYLIEALDRNCRGGLSGPARAGLAQVIALIRRESAFWEPVPVPGQP
jgi:hydrogenase maturation protease